MQAIKHRRASAKTNYGKRVELLKGRLPRLVVRKSNRNVLIQLVKYEPDGDKVLASVSSRELSKFNWLPHSNIPTAYLTGMLLAKKARPMNVGKVVLDTGLSKPVKFNVLFAAAKGCADNGVELPNSIEFDEARLTGKHVAEYAKGAKGVEFSAYKKKGVEPAKLDILFNDVKKKIESSD